MTTQMEDRTRHLFGISIETKIMAADSLSESIARAAQRLIDCLLNDGKILICGQGGSAANTMHFSSAMLNHFEVERPTLPVINLCSELSALTSFANDNNYEQAFAQQIQALGGENDVLMILTTSGNATPMMNALHAADERGMDTIALSGRDGGVLASHLGPEDIELRVTSDNSARIREVHLFIIHCFCHLIDNALFGQETG